MEVVKAGRLSTGSRDAPNIDAEIMRNRVKLGGGTRSDRHPYVNLRTNDHDYDQDQQHLQHPRNRSVKVFNKVQVVYYLTRHGQLEHPHYLEVSHLATQPLRLRGMLVMPNEKVSMLLFHFSLMYLCCSRLGCGCALGYFKLD